MKLPKDDLLRELLWKMWEKTLDPIDDKSSLELRRNRNRSRSKLMRSPLICTPIQGFSQHGAGWTIFPEPECGVCEGLSLETSRGMLILTSEMCEGTNAPMIHNVIYNSWAGVELLHHESLEHAIAREFYYRNLADRTGVSTLNP